MQLKGMTWDHPRAYEPLVATSAEFSRSHPNVEIVWDKRSLQAFADFPIRQMAEEYDLMVIDHPHVGLVAKENCLVALDTIGRDAELQQLAREALSVSHVSYQYEGHQWALAIDAATQVSSYRPDLIAAPPVQWAEVIALAKQGRVLCPLKPVDSLMTFFTLSANRGTPCRIDGNAGEPLIAPDIAKEILSILKELASHIPAQCLSMNPIETYEWLGRADNQQYAYCPFGYGYTNYAREGFRSKRLRFTDIPELIPGGGPRGSTIGGTGIAVSSLSRYVDVAVDYAFWVSSAECQRGLYFNAGGQPGNVVAWDDDRCNAVALDFFRGTRRTLDSVYLRPRYPGYIDFQDKGGDVVNAFLRGLLNLTDAAAALEAAYQRSLMT